MNILGGIRGYPYVTLNVACTMHPLSNGYMASKS